MDIGCFRHMYTHSIDLYVNTVMATKLMLPDKHVTLRAGSESTQCYMYRLQESMLIYLPS